MRGLQNKELIFYLKKDNATQEVASSFAIGEMGSFWQSYKLTITSSVKWEFIIGARVSHSQEELIAVDDISVDIDRNC
jgi:hypothetical protein